MKKITVLTILLVLFLNCYSQSDSIYQDQEYLENLSYYQILNNKIRNTSISGIIIMTGFFIPTFAEIIKVSNPIFFYSFIIIEGIHLTRIIILNHKLKKELKILPG